MIINNSNLFYFVAKNFAKNVLMLSAESHGRAKNER